MLEFRLNRNGARRGKSSRRYPRYPRARINNLGGDRKAHLAANYYKNNWDDDNWTYLNLKHLSKFLMSNLGKPIDKVFSEYIKRCDPRTVYAKEEFWDYIEDKEEISPLRGGFYVTNGILNYKKREKKHGISRK